MITVRVIVFIVLKIPFATTESILKVAEPKKSKRVSYIKNLSDEDDEDIEQSDICSAVNENEQTEDWKPSKGIYVCMRALYIQLYACVHCMYICNSVCLCVCDVSDCGYLMSVGF